MRAAPPLRRATTAAGLPLPRPVPAELERLHRCGSDSDSEPPTPPTSDGENGGTDSVARERSGAELGGSSAITSPLSSPRAEAIRRRRQQRREWLGQQGRDGDTWARERLQRLHEQATQREEGKLLRYASETPLSLEQDEGPVYAGAAARQLPPAESNGGQQHLQGSPALGDGVQERRQRASGLAWAHPATNDGGPPDAHSCGHQSPSSSEASPSSTRPRVPTLEELVHEAHCSPLATPETAHRQEGEAVPTPGSSRPPRGAAASSRDGAASRTQRAHLMAELLATEEAYVSSLQTLCVSSMGSN
eukprot:COSAG01_NODE_2944_length_6814_cov_144.052271_9_plen_305_part_00